MKFVGPFIQVGFFKIDGFSGERMIDHLVRRGTVIDEDSVQIFICPFDMPIAVCDQLLRSFFGRFSPEQSIGTLLVESTVYQDCDTDIQNSTSVLEIKKPLVSALPGLWGVYFQELFQIAFLLHSYDMPTGSKSQQVFVFMCEFFVTDHSEGLSSMP